MSELNGARLSATVLVLRSEAVGAPSVFMGQRASRSSFMADAWVFPGGAVDGGDEALARGAGVDGPSALSLLGGAERGLAEGDALGIFGAALRELFEEAGILLCRGDAPPLDTPSALARLRDARLAVLNGEASLADVAAAEGLSLDASLLYPFGRWRTPDAEPKRFDAFFFVARLPAGQEAGHAPAELVKSRWLTADAALKEHAAGGFWLAPPTFRVLKDVAALGGADAVIAASPSRSMAIIQPRLDLGEEVAIVLPGDPTYPCPPGDQVEGPTRMILTAERAWKEV